MVGDPWDPVPAARRLGGQEGANLGGERLRDPFVGVEGEDPIVAGHTCGEVLLIDVAGPGACFGSGSLGPGDRERVVNAARVNDDDLVGPGGAVDGGGDVCGFVQRDDGDRDTRHGGDVIARSCSARPRSAWPGSVQSPLAAAPPARFPNRRPSGGNSGCFAAPRSGPVRGRAGPGTRGSWWTFPPRTCAALPRAAVRRAAAPIGSF